MSKGFLGVIAAVIIIFVGIVAFSGKSNSPSSNSSKNSSTQLSQHIRGQGTSGVTLVEYGDFQCPYCQQYESTIESVVSHFGDQIKFQFRNFPLTSLHPNAFAAARAAEAADKQGKYWDMHDLLYNQINWQNWTEASNPNPMFENYAKELGLNVDQFKKDFSSSQVNAIINADMNEGNRLNITGTPTFYINGKKTDLPNDASSIEKTIQKEIDQKSKS